MTMKRLMTGMAMVLGALVYAAHGAGPAAAETFITVASTTSTQNSGLYDYILPRFTTKTGITVRVIAVGTGQAVRLAKNGDADVLFVHHKASEEKFVADGFGIRRGVEQLDAVEVDRGGDVAKLLLALELLGEVRSWRVAHPVIGPGEVARRTQRFDLVDEGFP